MQAIILGIVRVTEFLRSAEAHLILFPGHSDGKVEIDTLLLM